MSPIVALNLGNGRDVSSTEGRSTARKDDKHDGEDEERRAPAHPEGRHIRDFDQKS